MIKREGSKYTVYSESGKRLSKPYASEGEAKKRLAEVEAFKHMKKSYEEGKDLKAHEKGAKKRFKKIRRATEDIQDTLKELTAADESLTKAVLLKAHYKNFLSKGADDPSYTVEMRDGIADIDRANLENKQKREDYERWLNRHKNR
jgi:hypothetical protein